VELLGIALGISKSGTQSVELRKWIVEVLGRTRKEHATAVWSASLQAAAEIALLVPGIRIPATEDARNLLELGAISWLRGLSGIRSASADLDRAVLETAASTYWQPVDIAEAALVAYTVRQAVSRSIESAVEKNWALGRESVSAEEVVVRICRRFHRCA